MEVKEFILALIKLVGEAPAQLILDACRAKGFTHSDTRSALWALEGEGKLDFTTNWNVTLKTQTESQ